MLVMTFPRAKRLRLATEFKQVFSRASRVGESGITVLYCRNAIAFPRLGFAVSKKQIPTAVQRNRIKRIVKESFRRQTLPAVDIVVMAYKTPTALTNSELRQKIQGIWAKINKQCG